jgi:hypothetical protein
MFCCLFLAMAATPVGAWLIGPAPSTRGVSRAWVAPLALSFALAMAAAMAAWAALLWFMPGFDAFRPLCRVGAWLMQGGI